MGAYDAERDDQFISYGIKKDGIILYGRNSKKNQNAEKHSVDALRHSSGIFTCTPSSHRIEDVSSMIQSQSNNHKFIHFGR